MTSGIYSITHIATGMRYVGQSMNIERRAHQHRYSCRQVDGNSLIARAIKEHGWSAFKLEVLEVCNSSMLMAETRWINELNAWAPYGFNATSECYAGPALRSKSAIVARAQRKQEHAGWKRLSLRLPPEAALDLERECGLTGLKPTAIITALLAETRHGILKP